MTKYTITVQETAGILGVSKNTVYKAIRQGNLPFIRVGRSIRVLLAPILVLVEANSPDVSLRDAVAVPNSHLSGNLLAKHPSEVQ